MYNYRNKKREMGIDFPFLISEDWKPILFSEGSLPQKDFLFCFPGVERENIKIEMREGNNLYIEVDYSEQDDRVCSMAISFLDQGYLNFSKSYSQKEKKIYVHKKINSNCSEINATFKNSILKIEFATKENICKTIPIKDI